MASHIRRAVPPTSLSAAALSRVRARLVAEITDVPFTVSSADMTQRMRISGISVAAVAAVVVAILLATNLLRDDPAPGSLPASSSTSTSDRSATPSEAAETVQQVLEAAATAAAARPAVTSGFTKVVAKREDLSFGNGLSGPSRPREQPGAEPYKNAWIEKSTTTTLIPADLGQKWQKKYFEPELGETYGDKVESERRFNDTIARGRSMYGDAGEYVSSDVEQYEYESNSREAEMTVDTYLSYIASDLTPETLVADIGRWFYHEESGADGNESSTASATQSENVISSLTLLLSYNAGPPEARATMLRALALLEGSSLASSEGSVRTIVFDPPRGSTPKSEADYERGSISVDVDTGAVVGSTYSVNDGSGVVPEDVPSRKVTYEVSQVPTATF